MEGINTFVSVFCVTAVMIGGIKLLLGGALEESGKYILALVLLTVTVAAITNTSISFKTNRKQAIAKTNDYSENLIAYEAQYVIKSLLEENSIDFKKITIKTTKNQEDNIVISEVVVFGAEEKEKVENLIMNTRITTKVTFK